MGALKMSRLLFVRPIEESVVAVRVRQFILPSRRNGSIPSSHEVGQLSLIFNFVADLAKTLLLNYADLGVLIKVVPWG